MKVKRAKAKPNVRHKTQTQVYSTTTHVICVKRSKTDGFSIPRSDRCPPASTLPPLLHESIRQFCDSFALSIYDPCACEHNVQRSARWVPRLGGMILLPVASVPPTRGGQDLVNTFLLVSMVFRGPADVFIYFENIST